MPDEAPTDVYLPRPVSDLGLWEIGGISFKAYGLTADGQTVTDELIGLAKDFALNDVMPVVKREGQSNGLGFIIIHPGITGVSILVHWWTEGSVLCLRIRRQLYDADEPMDTVERPVVGCVWELGIITREQEIWKRTMMTETPDPTAYLKALASASAP